MPKAAIKSDRIQKSIEAVRESSNDLLETARQTAKGEHPGQWPAFGSISDVREVLRNQLQKTADTGTNLQDAISRDIGSASAELLRIARNVFWYVSHLRGTALPAIIDADLNDKTTRIRLAKNTPSNRSGRTF